MNINDGKGLLQATIRETENQDSFFEDRALAAWSYKYVFTRGGPILKRVLASQQEGENKIERITPQETGVIALASRYLKSNIPKDSKELEELANFQFALQSYLGLTDPKVVLSFYQDLIESIKPEHNKLIPTLHIYHAQIHALKLAYDRLKGCIKNADITTRVIFGLVCIEFMKLQVRLYLIEPLARTTEGQSLDWIYMLDMVFEDFSMESPYNRESFRKKSVVSINLPLEKGLHGAMKHILAIRNHVAALKSEKKKGKIDHLESVSSIDLSGAKRLIDDIKKRLGDKGV